MELNLATPALLFPAISLLLLAFTNRFLAITKLIRDLHQEYFKSPGKSTISEIKNLRKRLYLIRNMQAFGVLSLFFCVFCMFLLFIGFSEWAKYIFAFSLFLMLFSLALSIMEIQISTNALNLRLSDIEELNKKK
ncbi:MAG: DUF2721 domain-containing protein [Leptospiraceae bacterium]|nr:DUF2721 domain-containing protein [Leptospiraceae bacterium]